ncbi:peptidase S8 [Cryobacterium melibiosiphilum]|uniref:Peptidase S8 n=1 Tax=Cryobacterium melibiosiphilum TaxID=995039 RepID=A0A3A5MMA2_9MICO|nr:S8 family serine peptidase [Cryobacterium melibiosiphilum]RJT88248.1 peptidase S8 [Cryobacterium melibiosiphilum]
MIEPGSENFARGTGRPPGSEVLETTGRFIVVFDEGEGDPTATLRNAGLGNVANSRDFSNQSVDPLEVENADATIFSELGIAVVSADRGQVRSFAHSAEDRGPIQSISPELVHHIQKRQGTQTSTGQGQNSQAGQQAGFQTATRTDFGANPLAFQDSPQFTWGLQATQVPSSPWSGRGIRVAVLDTGFDSTHPDFAGRQITTQSFIPNEQAQDGHGHGTHCIGTSTGTNAPGSGPRYGIAYGAEIFVGKVLSNAGSGSDGGIIAGINWAVANKVPIISMSLGANVPQVHPPYTAAGRRALNKGSLIIAAAGNNAARPQGNFGFVTPPANSPHILAVAALQQNLDVTFFSARTLAERGGQVDIGGPGFQVHSSWLMPAKYNTISGTSMATPHIAGLAALWAEATGFRGRELWATLVQEGQRLLAPSVDVGSGLGLAPQRGSRSVSSDDDSR